MKKIRLDLLTDSPLEADGTEEHQQENNPPKDAFDEFLSNFSKENSIN